MVGELLTMLFLLPKNFRAGVSCMVLSCLLANGVFATPAALNSEAAIMTATADLDAKNYEAALLAIAPALEAHPGDPEIINLKGAILTKQKNYDAARLCFAQALQLSPGFFPARYNIGALLALQHQWDAAINYYRNLLIDQPDNELVEYKLLLLLLHQDADPELQKKLFATDLPTNTPAWYFATAARCYKNGRVEEAEKYLEVAGNIYGHKTAIFQEELDESGLNALKKQ